MGLHVPIGLRGIHVQVRTAVGGAVGFTHTDLVEGALHGAGTQNLGLGARRLNVLQVLLPDLRRKKTRHFKNDRRGVSPGCLW